MILITQNLHASNKNAQTAMEITPLTQVSAKRGKEKKKLWKLIIYKTSFFQKYEQTSSAQLYSRVTQLLTNPLALNCQKGKFQKENLLNLKIGE